MKRHRGSNTRPVPGKAIVTEIRVDNSVVSFRCKLKERKAVVLNNGKCTLAA